MKNLITLACLVVFSFLTYPVHAVNSDYEPDFLAESALISNLDQTSEAGNQIFVSLTVEEDIFPINFSPELDCSITVTVTVSGILGSVSVSGTMSGPCDELRVSIEAFINDLIDLGKDRYNRLK